MDVKKRALNHSIGFLWPLVIHESWRHTHFLSPQSLHTHLAAQHSGTHSGGIVLTGEGRDSARQSGARKISMEQKIAKSLKTQKPACGTWRRLKAVVRRSAALAGSGAAMKVRETASRDADGRSHRRDAQIHVRGERTKNGITRPQPYAAVRPSP